MSFQSCIKIPGPKKCTSPEETPSTRIPPESLSRTYNEMVSIANEVFGHRNWSHAITSQTIDFTEYVMGKYEIGCAAFVRVQLADGTFHEELGYSNAKAPTKGAAIYSARVASTISAFKKALRCFDGKIAEKIRKIAGKRPKSKSRKPANSKNVSWESGKSNMTSASGAKRSDVHGEFTHYVIIASEDEETVNEPPAKKRNIETKPASDDKPNSATDAATVATSTERLITSPNINETAKSTVEAVQARTTAAKTEEHLRLERKRKQKQRQEEFQKTMKDAKR